MYSVENTSKWYCFIEFLQIKVYSKLIYGTKIYGGQWKNRSGIWEQKTKEEKNGYEGQQPY